MLTEDRKKDYVKSGGGFCPYCMRKDIVADEQVQMDGPVGGQTISCNLCGERWSDLVSLTGIQEIE
jgi:hypothetical protein